MSRLSIEISQEEHRLIKAIAAKKGMSIKDLILHSVMNSKSSEEESKLESLRRALISGEESGFIEDFNWDAHRENLIAKHIARNGEI